MEKRRGPLRQLTYGLMALLLTGCLVSGAVTLVSEGRGSDFNPWVVGFGGTLMFVVCAGQTVLAGRALWQAWQMRLFGEQTWAVLTAKESRWDADSTQFWTAHVAGAGFRHTIDTGVRDPGPVGEPLRVRRHAASGQAELTRTFGVVAILVRDVLVLPVGLLVLAVFTAGICYGLVQGKHPRQRGTLRPDGARARRRRRIRNCTSPRWPSAAATPSPGRYWAAAGPGNGPWPPT